MCSICGLIDFKNTDNLNSQILEKMGKTMKHRGPDESGQILTPFASFQHNRLSVMDIENGKQPMSAVFKGQKYTIIYNGEIYNSGELRADIKTKGV